MSGKLTLFPYLVFERRLDNININGFKTKGFISESFFRHLGVHKQYYSLHFNLCPACLEKCKKRRIEYWGNEGLEFAYRHKTTYLCSSCRINFRCRRALGVFNITNYIKYY